MPAVSNQLWKMLGENTFIVSPMEILSGRRTLLQFDQKKKKKSLVAGKTELYRMCKQDFRILGQQLIKSFAILFPLMHPMIHLLRLKHCVSHIHKYTV